MARLRRFLVVSAIALWMGGFTFYSGLVIPIATDVLGSHRAAGFITQRVTSSLNICGVLALAILLWNLIADRESATRQERRRLTLAWAFLAIAEIALVALHPILDAQLDRASQQIVGAHFIAWHRTYLWISTAQWVVMLPFTWITLVVWQRADQRAD